MYASTHRRPGIGVTVLALLAVWGATALDAATTGYTPPPRHEPTLLTYRGHTDRPLRYRPDDTDFVIHNGAERFNRPLYGANTPFRCDAGDLPELSLYARGRAGNLRFGLVVDGHTAWLDRAGSIEARYRPGSMLYELSDPAWKGGRIHLTVLTPYDGDGVLVEIRTVGLPPSADLIVGFGGANGMRCRRNGDIGCEPEPVATLFRLRPDQCGGDRYQIEQNRFSVESPRQHLAGVFPPGARLSLADAGHWANLAALLESADTTAPPTRPVLLARFAVRPDNEAAYLAVQWRPAADSLWTAESLPDRFIDTERQRRLRAHQVRIDSPDPFINAAMTALCMAADGIWDEASGTVMHGAVAWRSRLLGWRGPYANDVLGWHERARRHLTYWAGRQITDPATEVNLPADPEAHLARNEPTLHSRGALSQSHYDMNLVYIDALLRHLLWTGDWDLARELWPVIERHLAWERRLFRRPFGRRGDLPLYEAYAAIWASDDLQYSGGGVTHSSAYNVWHNVMAARLAEHLGKDPAPYRREAAAVLKAMRRLLWLPQDGWYGECKDWLGRQAVHPSFGVWTFYHAVDSRVTDPFEAWQFSRAVEIRIPHIPVTGPNVPDEGLVTCATTDWLPYTWSTNNVVMAEAAHTALATWQAQRPEAAFRLLKGCLLDSMYLGLCPGNAGMCTAYDMARGETQRDFGDAVGTTTRALVEGLFGVEPDLLAGTLTIRPGWPARWPYARLLHPELDLRYRRTDNREEYRVVCRFGRPVRVRLSLPALSSRLLTATCNGQAVAWEPDPNAIGRPRVRLDLPAGQRHLLELLWKGSPPERPRHASRTVAGASLVVRTEQARLTDLRDPQGALTEPRLSDRRLTGRTTGHLGARTAFVRLAQGDLTWWTPLTFDNQPAWEILDPGHQSADRLVLILQNHTPATLEGPANVVVSGVPHATTLSLAPHGQQSITLPVTGLWPGTQSVEISGPNDLRVAGRVVHWRIQPPTSSVWRSVSLPANGRLADIFKQQYLSPRSPFCSLAIPVQGIGSWCHYDRTVEIDTLGLRQRVAQGNGWLTLPNGVRFHLNTAAPRDTLFVSLWDNHPNEVTVTLQGHARHVYLLLAGTTNSMQSRFDNAEVVVRYRDGGRERLALRNPTTWWPIEQDYFIDDYAFSRPEPVPPRLDLKTGRVRVWDSTDFRRHPNAWIDGGAATVLDVCLDPRRDLASLELRALANEVIVGLLGLSLVQ